MTGRLGELLREEAHLARSYDVYERSLRTARRRRIVSWAVVLAVLALVVPLVAAAVLFSGAGSRFGALLSPDGRTVRVHIVDAAGRELAAFVAPGGYRMAGKSSWTRDGRAFARVRPGGKAWEPRWFDGTTGAEIAG